MLKCCYCSKSWQWFFYFVTVLSESSNSLGCYSDLMDAYVFAVSCCKVLVSATVVLFVQSVILCVSFLTRTDPSSLLKITEKISSKTDVALNLSKVQPLIGPNTLKRFRRSASQRLWWRSPWLQAFIPDNYERCQSRSALHWVKTG